MAGAPPGVYFKGWLEQIRQGETVASNPRVMWIAPVGSSFTSQILPWLASVRGEDGSMKRTETDAVSVLHSAHTLGVCMAMQVWVAFVNVVGKGCLLFVFGFYLFVVVIFTNCELAAAWLMKNLYRRTGNADSFRLKPPRRREGEGEQTEDVPQDLAPRMFCFAPDRLSTEGGLRQLSSLSSQLLPEKTLSACHPLLL